MLQTLSDKALLIHITGPTSADVNVYIGKHSFGHLQKIHFETSLDFPISRVEMSMPCFNMVEVFYKTIQVAKNDILLIKENFVGGTLSANASDFRIQLGTDPIALIQNIKFTADVANKNNILEIEFAEKYYVDSFNKNTDVMSRLKNLSWIDLKYSSEAT